MKAKIISLMNQKSIGKSTVAMALAGHFHFNRQLDVLIVDTDDEQQSINLKLRREKYLNERNHLNIIHYSLRNELLFEEFIRLNNEEFDIIIVDTAGTLIDSAAKFRLAELSDLIIVPISAKEMDVEAYKLFINYITRAVKDPCKVRILRNFYDSRNRDWKEHDAEFQGEYKGHRYLQAVIPERREYTRFHWTVRYNIDKPLQAFYKEIESIMEMSKKNCGENNNERD